MTELFTPTFLRLHLFFVEFADAARDDTNNPGSESTFELESGQKPVYSHHRILNNIYPNRS